MAGQRFGASSTSCRQPSRGSRTTLLLPFSSAADFSPPTSQTRANQRSAKPGRETSRLVLFCTQDLKVDRRALDWRNVLGGIEGTRAELKDLALWFPLESLRLRFLGVEGGCPQIVQVLEEH